MKNIALLSLLTLAILQPLAEAQREPPTGEMIERGRLIDTVEAWGPLFKISFDLFITSFGPSAWSSILSFKGNEGSNNCCNNGDRVPIVQLTDYGDLFFINSIDGNGNGYFHTGVELNKWLKIEIQQDRIDGKVFFLVKIDGQEINRLENYDPRSFEDVRVYAGDSFNDPANARYKNLHYENIEEDPITIAPHCGIKKKVFVIGGENTEINEYPWMALLRLKYQQSSGFFCGGTLINSRWILTAQHCIFQGVDKDSLEIRLGEHQRDTINETLVTKDFNVDQIVLHPDYNSPKSISNDIALVRLAEDADLSVYTPACLPDTDEDFSGQLATLAGWGITEDGGAANILQELEGLEILSDNQCSNPVIWGSKISSDMMCAGYEGGENACNGDSGGPLTVTRQDGAFTLAGVVSWGSKPCALIGRPAVYAEVSSK